MTETPSSTQPQSPRMPGASPSAGLAPAGGTGIVPEASITDLSPVGKRLGAYLVEFLLFIVTLGIGWLVWTLIILGRGQTPAKQLMHMRVVGVDNGNAASWGKMFVREFLAKLLISLVASATVIGLVLSGVSI